MREMKNNTTGNWFVCYRALIISGTPWIPALHKSPSKVFRKENVVYPVIHIIMMTQTKEQSENITGIDAPRLTLHVPQNDKYNQVRSSFVVSKCQQRHEKIRRSRMKIGIIINKIVVESAGSSEHWTIVGQEHKCVTNRVELLLTHADWFPVYSHRL